MNHNTEHKGSKSKLIQSSAAVQGFSAKIQDKHVLSPQRYLDSMLGARGYSIARLEAKNLSYGYKSSEPQIDNCYCSLIDVVFASDFDGLENLLSSGYSPNVCASDGEPIIHEICKEGNFEMLQILLDPWSSFNGH
jgi:hypothetical protein